MRSTALWVPDPGEVWLAVDVYQKAFHHLPSVLSSDIRHSFHSVVPAVVTQQPSPVSINCKE